MLKLLLDENIGFIVVKELSERGYDVKSILEEARGTGDEEIFLGLLKSAGF